MMASHASDGFLSNRLLTKISLFIVWNFSFYLPGIAIKGVFTVESSLTIVCRKLTKRYKCIKWKTLSAEKALKHAWLCLSFFKEKCDKIGKDCWGNVDAIRMLNKYNTHAQTFSHKKLDSL